MKKLTKLLIAILIGLNLLGCDPEESFYTHYCYVIFKNNSSQKIKLTSNYLVSDPLKDGYIKQVDTLIISAYDTSPADFYEGLISPYIISDEDNPSNIIELNVDGLLHSNYELYREDEFIKKWNPIAGYYGDEINSPYNYDSWKFVKYDKVIRKGQNDFIHGEIIFTITNEDLE